MYNLGILSAVFMKSILVNYILEKLMLEMKHQEIRFDAVPGNASRSLFTLTIQHNGLDKTSISVIDRSFLTERFLKSPGFLTCG